MTTQADWLKWCIDLACLPSERAFWSGARKIIPGAKLTFARLDDSITMEGLGYTKYKLTRLNEQYFVEDAVKTAMMLHTKNVERKKYASSAFHCYGHLLKATFENRSKRGSVMGPCIQSVVLTLRPHLKSTSIDIFYRTTEAFKKLPADFVWLRESILPMVPGRDQYPISSWNFHFVNVTIHPMYFATAIPHLPDPIATLELLRDRDPAFWQWAGKWIARYIVGGAASRSIEKFAQAQRSAMAANELILASGEGPRLMQYLSDNRASFVPQRTRFDVEAIEEAFDEALIRWKS
jgi:hypothetical protein